MMKESSPKGSSRVLIDSGLEDEGGDEERGKCWNVVRCNLVGEARLCRISLTYQSDDAWAINIWCSCRFYIETPAAGHIAVVNLYALVGV